MSLKKPKIMAVYRKMIVQKYFDIAVTLNISDGGRLGFLHTNKLIASQ